MDELLYLYTKFHHFLNFRDAERPLFVSVSVLFLSLDAHTTFALFATCSEPRVTLQRVATRRVFYVPTASDPLTFGLFAWH